MASVKKQLPADHRRAIGVRIVERRRTKRWNQREFARRIGIRYMRLSRLENGHVTISLPELIVIAEDLNAGLEEIVWGTERRTASASELELLPLAELEGFGSPEECAILRKVLRIFVEGLKAIRSMKNVEAGEEVEGETDANS